jgi:hypothetical protein
MGEVMSAATMGKSATMKSTVTAGKLVSIVTESAMVKSVTKTIIWMSKAVSAAVGVSGISTAVTVATWIAYVVATLG